MVWCTAIQIFLDVAAAFLTSRYLLALLVIAGIVFLLRKRRVIETIQVEKILLLFFICIFPFVISFVRNDVPPDRTFVIIFPILSLLIATVINNLVNSVDYLKKHRITFVLILSVYCTATFAFSFHKNQKVTCENIDASKREQTIFRNYYYSYYQPNKLVKEYIRIINSNPAPLVIYDSDYHGMRTYLDKYGLKYSDAKELEKTFAQSNSAYVLAIFPVSFEKKMRENYPLIKFENKNPFKDFHNLFYCEKIR